MLLIVTLPATTLFTTTTKEKVKENGENTSTKAKAKKKVRAGCLLLHPVLGTYHVCCPGKDKGKRANDGGAEQEHKLHKSEQVSNALTSAG